ncbi:AAA family ATPase [Alkaliphilus sp. B6464]|uniref:AAA family ATPase n=1 Tax=Alkaliphilus sp. B6464 TaxID=2731219 RepID=UPI001BA4F33B|nr:AAA family ATPase [Alkaliphilus sp. B6464]QUH22015.1 AAA family ATPase [Alkaliphilus sp. B6464]
MNIFSMAYNYSGQIRGTDFSHGDESLVYKSPLNTTSYRGKSPKASLARPIAEGIISLFDDSLTAVGITDDDRLYCEMTALGSNKTYQILFEEPIIQMYSKDFTISVDTNYAKRHYFVPIFISDLIKKTNRDLINAFDGLKEVVNRNGLPLTKSDDAAEKYFFLTNDNFYFEHKGTDYEVVVDKVANVTIKEDITPQITGKEGDYIYINGPKTKITQKKNKSNSSSKNSKKVKSKIIHIDFGEPLSEEMESKIPDFPDYMQIPFELEPVRDSIAHGYSLSVLQYGPTGTGKTTNVKLLCRDIRLPLVAVINCTEALDEFILGKFVPKGNEFIFFQSEVTDAIEWGGAVVFEELNFGDPRHLSFLNSLLDDNGFVRLDNGKVVKRHNCFRFFATMNNGYAGTNEINKALLNRFDDVVEVKELTEEQMKQSLIEETKIEGKLANDMLTIYKKIKTKIEEEELDTAISLRNLKRWANRIKIVRSPLEAAITTVINPVANFDKDLKNEILEIVKHKFPN